MDNTKGFTVTFGDLFDIIKAVDAKNITDTAGIIEATEVKLIATYADNGRPNAMCVFLASSEKHLYEQLAEEEFNDDDTFFVFPVTGNVLVINSGEDKITKIGELHAI